jgi:hypothetical protein
MYMFFKIASISLFQNILVTYFYYNKAFQKLYSASYELNGGANMA